MFLFYAAKYFCFVVCGEWLFVAVDGQGLQLLLLQVAKYTIDVVDVAGGEGHLLLFQVVKDICCCCRW